MTMTLIRFTGDAPRGEHEITGRGKRWWPGELRAVPDATALLLVRANRGWEIERSGDAADMPYIESGQVYDPVTQSPVSWGGSSDWATVEATRDGVIATAIQFRAATDTVASLGTIGLVINSASDAAAGNRIAASDADWTSSVNGASDAGRTRMIGPVGGAITRVHIGQLGLTAPLTDNGSGPVLAASNQMTELNFDAALGVTALLIVEGGPTDFAGASGTGSARYVTVYGLVQVAV